MHPRSGGFAASARDPRSSAASELRIGKRLAATHPVKRSPTSTEAPRRTDAAGPKVAAADRRSVPVSGRYHAPLEPGITSVINLDDKAITSSRLPSPETRRDRLTNASRSLDA